MTLILYEVSFEVAKILFCNEFSLTQKICHCSRSKFLQMELADKACTSEYVLLKSLVKESLIMIMIFLGVCL